MTALVAIFVMLALVFLVVRVLLVFVDRREDWRELCRSRQIELTDTIHWELGAVAAPVVRRRRPGGWLVSMTVPLDRPALVAKILEVTGRHFAALPAERFEIVLTPDRSSAWPRAAESATPRSAPTGRPLAA